MAGLPVCGRPRPPQLCDVYLRGDPLCKAGRLTDTGTDQISHTFHHKTLVCLFDSFVLGLIPCSSCLILLIHPPVITALLIGQNRPGCQISVQSGLDWPKMERIWNVILNRVSAQLDLKKIADISILGTWPTLEPNLRLLHTQPCELSPLPTLPSPYPPLLSQLPFSPPPFRNLTDLSN